MANAGKVALVTGANKGIGREITRQLGQHGFTVLAAPAMSSAVGPPLQS
jgi:NAD(P)-dependent dehydrogenase (short-subunit alcohol dehydrogenase family)